MTSLVSKEELLSWLEIHVRAPTIASFGGMGGYEMLNASFSSIFYGTCMNSDTTLYPFFPLQSYLMPDVHVQLA